MIDPQEALENPSSDLKCYCHQNLRAAYVGKARRQSFDTRTGWNEALEASRRNTTETAESAIYSVWLVPGSEANLQGHPRMKGKATNDMVLGMKCNTCYYWKNTQSIHQSLERKITNSQNNVGFKWNDSSLINTCRYRNSASKIKSDSTRSMDETHFILLYVWIILA